MLNRRYRAFICYSQQDNREAARLHRRIESFRVPKRLRGSHGRHGLVSESLAPIFRDRDELAASANIGERLHDALARSDFLIVLCSPAAARSKWVNAEIETFCALAPGNCERVLAVLLGGEPAVGDSTTECFPRALLAPVANNAGLTARYPLAADFRPGKDRRADAELRLFAALLGVEFNLLKQREQERRIGRLRLLLAAALAIGAAFAGVAGFAFRQQTVAQRAEARAVAASERAVRARAEAEKLTDFMLRELRPPLEKIGKLELLEPANEMVRRYYETVAPEELDTDVLRRRAQAFHSYAVDLRSHKRGARTISILLAAAAMRRRVTELEPLDGEAWQARAETHRFLALQRRDDGDTGGALQEIGAAKRFAARGLWLSPSDVKFAARTASLAIDEADVLMRAGRSAEARPLLSRALLELEALRVREPENVELCTRLAGAAWQLGNVCRRSGDFSSGEAAYRKSYEAAKDACEKEPGNIFPRRQKALAAGSLGQLFLESNRFGEAVSQLRVALDLCRAILVVDPVSLVYQDAVATNANNLAEAEFRTGDLDAASLSVDEVIRLRQNALDAGATDVRTRNLLAMAWVLQSQIESARSNHDAAIAAARRGVGLAEQLAGEAPNDVRLADDAAYLRSKLASALSEAGRASEAASEYRAAIARLEGVLVRDAHDPQLPRWRDRATWSIWLGFALHDAGDDGAAQSALREGLERLDQLARDGLPVATFANAQSSGAELLARLKTGTR